MEPIPLDSSEFEIEDFSYGITFRDYAAQGVGKIFLSLIPVARIELRFELIDVPESTQVMMAFESDEMIVTANGEVINGICSVEGGELSNQKIRVSLTPYIEPSVLKKAAGNKFKEIKCRLFDFPAFFGTRSEMVTQGNQSNRVDYLDLEGLGHSVHIFAFYDTAERVKRERATGRTQQTHGIQIIASDDFTEDRAKRTLDELMLFLSLASGRYVRPCCTHGVSENDEVVWSYLGSPNKNSRGMRSWFDHHHGSQIAEAYPLWSNRMNSDNWRKCLREVVQLYLAASDVSKGVEGGLILSQTALERLSYELFVLDRPLLSVDGFGKLKASDRLRLVVGSMAVSTEIPDHKEKLVQVGRAHNWPDMLEGLAQIRNSIVHPQIRVRDSLSIARYEAWDYSMWLLELALLHCIGYKGTYANRLTQQYIGTVEAVPWATIEENDV